MIFGLIRYQKERSSQFLAQRIRNNIKSKEDKITMKRKSLVLGLMLMPLLASCGGTAKSTSEKDTYKVTTAFSENASFDFGSKFDDNRFVITNQKDEEIAKEIGRAHV